MKKIITLIAIISCLTLSSCVKVNLNVNTNGQEDGIYQVALLQSLMQGEYDGIVSVEKLKTKGDIGLGTFDGVNGELIALDGEVYQALGDGTVVVADNNEGVPFATVTHFDNDIEQDGINVANIDELKEILNSIIEKEGKNQFYMMRMDCKPSDMVVRSELKQEKPYRPLNEALATDQREFNYSDIDGTIVAIYCPPYMDGLNTPGWHFHFISKDRTKGGHMLEVAFENGALKMDKVSGFDMELTDADSFNEKSLEKDLKDEIKKVEQK